MWGASGFAWSPHPALLCIEASVSADDPVAPLLQPQAAVGLLGLEMPTRRRNRLNGRVVERDDRGFSIAVAQSFGNCPKYIQAREWQPSPRLPGLVVAGEGVDDRWLALVQAADTFFIASQSPDANGGGVDVSHRGGAPGFVRCGMDGRLWIPDYSGNQLFNTLGNLTREPRCGLLFIDFDTGDLLQLQARAELVWPEHYTALNVNPPAGAERMLALTPGRWTLRYAGLPLSFSEPEASPFLPREEG